MEEARDDRVAFFDALYALDSEDSEEETNWVVALLRNSRESAQTPRSHDHTTAGNHDRLAREPRAVKGNLVRVHSAPLVLASSDSGRVNSSGAFLQSTTALKVVGRGQFNRSPLRSVLGTPRQSLRPSIRSDISMTGKRKRAKSVQLLPESQQIFKGLSFFFLPNDDIAPARRMRIRKAIEYGATWVREWRAGISHIIADRRLSYHDVFKFLKLSSLPTNTVLVSEVYPIECIQFRYLFDPQRPRYTLNGVQPGTEDVGSSSGISGSSDISLQLKPAQRDLLKDLTTPSHSEDGSGVEIVPETILRMPIATEPIAVDSSIQRSPGEYPTDMLQEAIIEATKLKHLPLDPEEDDEASETSRSGDHDSDEEETDRRKRPKIGNQTDATKESGFSCMHKHDGRDSPENPNSRTIEVLQEMSDYYDRMNDTWRPIAYRKAIASLRRHAHRVSSYDEALALPHVGQRLALKIEEIAYTNRLRRLENTKSDCNDEVLQKFLAIYGVGFAQASKWVNEGHRSLDDVVKHAQLTKNQKVGITHYEDFNRRIPRAEVEALGSIVTAAARTIDAKLQVFIMGSYRRGATSSGDIDLIITKPSTTLGCLRTIVLEQLIPALFAQGFLQTALAASSSQSGSKWHGACVLPSPSSPCPSPPANDNNNNKNNNPWRRIDFLMVPDSELGAALIYFTGNDIFNRSIRLLAGKKGMRLNQRGLWKDVLPRRVIRGASTTTTPTAQMGTLVEARSERRIFDILGVPWREAWERNA